MTPSVRTLLLKPPPWLPTVDPNLLYWFDIKNTNSLLVDSGMVLTAASSQYISATTSLAAQSSSYWVCGWVKLTAVGTNSQALITNGESGVTPLLSTTYNFGLYMTHNSGNPQFNWAVDNYTGAAALVTTSGTYAYGSTHFIICYFNSSNNTIGISVNGGAFETAAYVAGGGGAGPLTNITRIGASIQTTAAQFCNGTLDEFGMGTGVPNATDVSQLYKSGTGARIEEWGGFATPLSITITHNWKLNENGDTGYTTRNDNTGSHHLAAVNGPILSITGLANPLAVNNGDPVNQISDLSGNGRHLTQSVSTARALYQTGPVRLLFDQTNDVYAMASAPVLSTVLAMTVYTVVNVKSIAANKIIYGGGTNSFAMGFDAGASPKFRVLKVGVANIAIATNTGTNGLHQYTGAYTDGAATAQLRIDGVSIAQTFVGAQSCTVASAALGNSTGSNFFGDSIHEIFAYSAEKTNHIQPEAYLKGRHGSP